MPDESRAARRLKRSSKYETHFAMQPCHTKHVTIPLYWCVTRKGGFDDENCHATSIDREAGTGGLRI